MANFKISASPGGALTAANTASGDLIPAVDVSVGASDSANVYVARDEFLKLMGVHIQPGGRLTLVTATPVLTSDQTAKTSVYYTPYVSDVIPLYNSGNTTWLARTFSELTLSLDTTNHASGNLYDVFVWDNSGTISIGTGPAWTTATAGSGARGTGAGTTELQLLNGRWTNKVSITLKNGAGSGTAGVGANTALYVGTIYTTADGQTGMAFKPTPASGGTNNVLGVFNAYNRVRVIATNQDSTASWTYNSSTWRSANNSSSNRVTFVDGLQQERSLASYMVTAGPVNTGYVRIGTNINSTSATPTISAQGNAVGTTALYITPHAIDNYSPVLGLSYIQAMEKAGGGGTQTFYSNQSPDYQAGLQVQLMM